MSCSSMVFHGWTGTQPIVTSGDRKHWVVSRVDSGPQPHTEKSGPTGGRTLSGTQPSFHKRYKKGWTGLQPSVALSGVLKEEGPYLCNTGKRGEGKVGHEGGGLLHQRSKKSNYNLKKVTCEQKKGT